MFKLYLTLTVVLGLCEAAGPGAGRLVCYLENRVEYVGECTHVVYTGSARGDRLETLLKSYRNNNPRLKIVLRLRDDDKDLQSLLKSKHIQGLEVYEAHKTLNRTKIVETVQSARTAISKNGGGPLFLALPAYPELLAKYYDLRALVKIADLMMVQTHALGLVKKMTYHPSRLSGLWDMMNTDSVVDLAIGLGVPASKIVISLPATARQFTLQNQTLSTPGSPTTDEEPKEISQEDLCGLMTDGRWTLERDQDLSAPYAFKNTTWVSFEDASSVDVKGKYARVRGLAGLALHNADQDLPTPCGPTLKTSLAKVLNSQSRAPRALVLRSLEQEILSSPSAPGRALDALQLSPYRITQVVDSDGVIHSIREDTRTEFSCSRQGYFVHPRSCARFYRCVKFDQLSPEYTVFEFDCPAGLAFDSRYEVCVWPGSLPHSQACPGSSEIAPVPQTRFVCPEHEGYYADPENCRWFFACLDHGKAPLTAYEFRCPFGLGFDAEKLKCDWPWLVPACGNIARYEAEVHGYSGAALTGAAGFYGQTADSVNIAAHHSLVSGAALDNLVGIQTGFLSHADALDGNFIAAQEYANAGVQADAFSTDIGHQGQHGFVQAKNYNDEEKYTSGSLILDEYRLPKKAQISNAYSQGASYGNKGYVANAYQGNSYKNINSDYQDSGAYVHDPSGDFGIPYKHVDSPAVPYNHDDAAYKHTNDYNDFDRSVEGGKYIDFNSGQYAHENAGSYVTNNGYKVDYSGAYRNDDSGKYVAGVYRGDEGAYTGYTSGKLGFASNNQYNGYSNGEYLSGTKAFTGASHTLAAGAVNVGLVGKTTLVDDLNENYEANSFGGAHYYDRGVLISHDGSEVRNGNNAAYVTTPTTSGIPTTATPVAVTTAIPVTYKTSYVRVPPKTSVKEIFGYSQPAITHVQSAIVPIKHVTPEVDITGYNQAIDYQLYSQNNKAAIKAEGYDYPKPTIKFEDGNTYTTAAPAFNTAIKFDEGINTHVVSPTVSTLTQGFNHEIHDYVPRVAVEEPFKKVIAYTTGSPATANAFSHQTIHNVEHNINADVNNGYKYSLPTVVNTQAYNHAVHESDKGYEYKKLLEQTPLVSSTYKPQTFNHEFVHHQQEISHGNTYTPSVQISENSGYSTPEIKYEQTPVVSTTFRPRVNNHQVVHHQQQEVSYVNTYTPSVQIAETSGYEYKKPEIKFEQIPVVSTTYRPQIFNHQVIHQHTQVQHTPSVQITDNSGYQYSTPEIKYEQTPVVSTTYKPEIFNHQVVQQHEVNHINTYSPSVELSQASGYEYKKPEIKFEQTPVVSTTYRPRAFHHQVVHHQQDISHVNTYEASENSGYQYSTPEIKYEQTPVVSSTYKPQIINHQVIHKQEYSPAHQVSKDYDFKTGYEYSKPTIKFEQTHKTVEYTTAQPAIYKSNAHSHQTIHNVQQKYHVASTPESYLEQPSVTVYENPLVQFGQKITPAVTFNPIVQQHAINHVNQNLYSYPEIQKNVQTFDAGLSHTRTSHIHHAGASRNENKDAVFVSTTPSQLIYEDHYVDYETPEKINTYNAPAYIPPKSEYASVSTVSPLSTSEQERYYKELQYESQKVVPIQQVQFLTTHEQTKLKSINFEPQITSTYKPIQYTPQIQVDYKADEYLPPVVSTSKPVITTFKQTYLPPISTTSAPKFTPEYLPPKVDYLPPSTTAKPFFKSTTESTYKAPEYLPPLSEEEPKVVNFESFNVNNYDTDANIKYNPYQDFNNEGVVASTTFAPKRKQNIVVETAKSNLLGFGTVGPDAGLVSPAYIPVTSTYAPSKQEFFEVTPSATPIRRTKPKVAVVTKINDFNPLLVRKLGAVCSCQSPVLVLKGKRPVSQQEYVDYDADDYDDVGRGDIGSTPRAAAIKSFDSKHVTPVPIVSSSFNPIIVPDDSFYQDYLESDKPKELYSESFVSPTPVAVSSSTERIVKIRPRVKAVTAAPTYKTVLIKESVTPAVVIKNAEGIESQSFDRYGPGGWRSRDETLQGSVDCQRAGLFRHPKQCNKFYACRWDCTKQRFTLHVFNCPVQLSFDPSIGACNWPSQGPACQGDTLLTNAL